MTTVSADSAARGPYAKGIQRRREILDRALEVFAEKGAESTSLRAIGQAIGVSHAALTHYFESREALLVEVLRERDVAAAAAVQGPPGPLGDLAAIADLNVTIPGLVAMHTVMMATAIQPGHDVARKFFTERFAAARTGLASQIADSLAERGVDTDIDLPALASLLLAASDGLQIQWLLDDSVDIAGSLRLLERLVTPGSGAGHGDD